MRFFMAGRRTRKDIKAGGGEKQKARFPAGLLQRLKEGIPGGYLRVLRKLLHRR
jgi:hypothetical protein